MHCCSRLRLTPRQNRPDRYSHHCSLIQIRYFTIHNLLNLCHLWSRGPPRKIISFVSIFVLIIIFHPKYFYCHGTGVRGGGECLHCLLSTWCGCVGVHTQRLLWFNTEDWTFKCAATMFIYTFRYNYSSSAPKMLGLCGHKDAHEITVCGGHGKVIFLRIAK